MPLPIILGGAALVAVATGAKKAYDGYTDKSEANEMVAKAKADYEVAAEKLNAKNQEAYDKLGNLGQLQLEIGKDINEFQTLATTLLEKLEDASHKHINLNIPEYEMKKISTMSINAASYATKLAGGAAGGAAAAYAVYGGVMALAAASTGTPIAALSGVAAYNATLAAIGGGSLAAGGLGMAGGAMILSGVVAAPVLAVAGWAFASHAADALEKAKEARGQVTEYQSKAQDSCEHLKNTIHYITKVEDNLLKLRVEFSKYLEDLKLAEMLVKRGQQNILANEKDILTMVQNGYAIAAIMTDVITTPLFKAKKLKGDIVTDKDGVPEFEADSNGVKMLNAKALNEILDESDRMIQGF